MKTNVVFKSIIAVFCLVAFGYAQDPTPTPAPPIVGEVTVTTKFANSDPLYQKIRQNLNVKVLSGEVAVVNNLVLRKDCGTFALKSGEIYFLAPVEGRVTGAVFIGDGEFSLTPPVENEKKALSVFTGAPEIKETFSQVVMYFSDKTFDEVKSSPNVKMAASGSQLAAASAALQEKEKVLRKRFGLNMSSRILADFLTPQRQGFFVSLIDGKKYGKFIYQIDPLGITEGGILPFAVYPEQVAVIGYEESNYGFWTSFHMAEEYKKGTANSSTDRRFYDITNHDIDTTIQGQRLSATDEITIKTREPGIKFLPFELYGTLRVKTVTNENGEELSFIQEKKDEDADFGVILADAPEVDKPFKIKVEYEGLDVVNQEGKGNFILNPSARSTWYPNNPFTAFGDRATFNLTFRYPKQYVMVGVGSRVGQETEEGGTKISKWTSDGIEYEVAGFNYGDFKSKIVSDPSGYDLEVFANREVPDEIRAMQNQIEMAERNGGTTETNLRALSTTSGMDNVMSSAQNSMRLYDAYFGKLPYKRFAMTQQPAANFGQAWTTLVYMPYAAYFGSSQRSQMMGTGGGTSVFWTEVAPHELAHQWWGHIVGWKSYRDQWMSEGFATFSASLYLQFVQKDINSFNSYWETQRKRVTEASPRTKGIKPYTAGPLTQGVRLINAKVGNMYVPIVYPKGAYVLHMLRMMLADRKEGDAKFQAMMRDFTSTYYNKAVSTEDFKTIVEKHMTPKMDIDKNGKMDWFFDEWVYGTEVPAYKLEYSVDTSSGKTILSGKITQSGVSDNFAMIVPLYLDFGNGWVSAGSVTIVGNKSFDLGNIPLPQAPKKVAICALSDVLATSIENVKK